VKLKLVRIFFFLYKLTADQTRTLFQKILATVLEPKNRSEVRICGREKEKESWQKKEVVVS